MDAIRDTGAARVETGWFWKVELIECQARVRRSFNPYGFTGQLFRHLRIATGTFAALAPLAMTTALVSESSNLAPIHFNPAPHG